MHAPCCETFGVTPPACLCLLAHGHTGPHVCANCGAIWQVTMHPLQMWPGPGGTAARIERLLTHYGKEKRG